MNTSRGRRIVRSLPGAAARAGTKLRRLERDELWLFLQAPFMLPLAAIALRWRGLARVQERGLRKAPRYRPPASDVERLAKAERVAWCVQVAAAYGPWPANCLQRSVVLCRFLHRRGLAADLRIGVRTDDEGRMDFHAWVEFDGHVVNDKRDIRTQYRPFDGARLPSGDAFG